MSPGQTLWAIALVDRNLHASINLSVLRFTAAQSACIGISVLFKYHLRERTCIHLNLWQQLIGEESSFKQMSALLEVKQVV